MNFHEQDATYCDLRFYDSPKDTVLMLNILDLTQELEEDHRHASDEIFAKQWLALPQISIQTNLTFLLIIKLVLVRCTQVLSNDASSCRGTRGRVNSSSQT